MRVQGKGPAGFVDGEVTLELADSEGGTEFRYRAEVQVGGQVARLGQRLISGVTKEMAGQFFEAFARDGVEGPSIASKPAPIRAFFVLLWRTLLNLLGLSRRS